MLSTCSQVAARATPSPQADSPNSTLCPHPDAEPSGDLAGRCWVEAGSVSPEAALLGALPTSSLQPRALPALPQLSPGDHPRGHSGTRVHTHSSLGSATGSVWTPLLPHVCAHVSVFLGPGGTGRLQ